MNHEKAIDNLAKKDFILKQIDILNNMMKPENIRESHRKITFFIDGRINSNIGDFSQKNNENFLNFMIKFFEHEIEKLEFDIFPDF